MGIIFYVHEERREIKHEQLEKLIFKVCGKLKWTPEEKYRQSYREGGRMSSNATVCEI